MSEASLTEYQGKPLIVLRYSADDKFAFQFGVRKAKLVLAHIEDIRRFVQQQTLS